jgi:hypothetical protein
MVCLALDPRFTVSLLAKGVGLLRVIKICSTPFFGEEVNLPHFVGIYTIVKIPLKYEQRCFVRPNSPFPSPVSSCFATR